MLPFRTTRRFGIAAPLSNVVDIWKIALDRPGRNLEALAAVLDAAEQARARRLWEGPLRSRFIVAHAAARHILAHYLRVPPGGIKFDRLPSGKPRVVGTPLSFNLSQSGSLAVVAVATGGRVGIDVEHVRPITDADNMMAQLFAPGEARQYSALPPAERVAAWFSGWTRKEAFLKATGETNPRAFRSFEVDLSPEAAAPRIAAGNDDNYWFMRSFCPAPGYAGAVAGDFPIDVINRFDWSGPTDALEPAAMLDRLEPLTVPV